MSSKNPNVIIKVPERTPFDKSHKWYGTVCTGSLVPLMVDEVIPNTKVKCRIALSVTMPPLVSDTLMNLKYQVTAFFVPMRLCSGSFEDWYIQGEKDYLSDPSGTANVVSAATPVLPFFQNKPTDEMQLCPVFDPAAPPSNYENWNSRGQLADFMGIKGVLNSTTGQNFSVLPFVAYHLIWSHWFRRSDIQKDPFIQPDPRTAYRPTYGGEYWPSVIPYIPFFGQTALELSETKKNNWLLADGHNLFALRQVNFGFDYFTNAFTSASQPDMEVTVSSNKFSIKQLRSANSLQQFGEINQLPARRYVDVLKARHNANLKDSIAQKPVLLGSANYEVYSRGVSVTADNSDAGGSGSTISQLNAQAGGRVGNAYGSGSDFIIDGFVANEPGYIFIMGALIPRVNYASGCRRYIRRYTHGLQSDITEMANHMLQNVGNQPIYASELVSAANYGTAVFGYTDRYADFMHYENEVHGEYCEDSFGTIRQFVSQRVVTGTPQINNAFLQIPVNYLDGVVAVDMAWTHFSAMVNCDFDYKVTMPLYEYSLPSLQNPAYEHGNSVAVHRGGFRF